MVESVFNEFLKQGLIKHINVEEAIPSKGKPAMKEAGLTTIWIVKIDSGNGQALTLLSARGSPREWASLDNLTKWLRARNVQTYSVNFMNETSELLQQNLRFANETSKL